MTDDSSDEVRVPTEPGPLVLAPGAVRALAAVAGRRSDDDAAVRAEVDGLLARGLLERGADGALRLAESGPATIFSAMQGAGVLWRAMAKRRGSQVRRLYALSAELGVDVSTAVDESLVLEPFATVDALRRLAVDLEIADRPVSAAPVPVNGPLLERAGAAVAARDSTAATTAFRGLGADEASASRLTAALLGKRAAGLSACVRVAVTGEQPVGTLSWIDGGEHGLWVLPTPRASDETVVPVRPVTRHELEALGGALLAVSGLDGWERLEVDA